MTTTTTTTKMIRVVKTADSDEGQQFIAAVEDILLSENVEPERVAFDCEGFALGRLGTVELVSICFSNMDVFLVDMVGGRGGEPDPDVVRAVKMLFEDSKVIKIIHDCNMDCDALFHLHGISLKNVHDTSCFHAEISYEEDKNLNHVLSYNGVQENAVRDNSIYKTNPEFWKTRPLTKTMIEWAASDVNKLFDLADNQLDSITNNARKMARALAKSKQNTRRVRDLTLTTELRVRNRGAFIGRGGSNLRRLQEQTGTKISQPSGSRTWLVYHDPTTDALAIVKRAMKGDGR